MGRIIYPSKGWYQGTLKKNTYQGEAILKRGYTLRKMPVTKNFYTEKGMYADGKREGLFTFEDTDQNIYNLRFDKNKLVEVLDSPGVSKQKQKEIMNEGLNFFDYEAISKSQTDDAKPLLDYLKDKIDKQEIVDSEYVYKEVSRIVENRRLRIQNMEIFALLQWKLTVLNDIEYYLKKTPDNYKSLHDEDAKVEPEEINRDLLNQAK